jgi:hypothetical protein
MRRMIDLCKKPTYEKWEQFVIDEVIQGSKTCKVSVDLEGFTHKFKKVASNKWVCNEGPSGMCDSFFLITLEHEPNAPGLWTYTQTRTYANQDTAVCKALEVGKPLIYNWHDQTLQMNCEFVEFGF